MTSLKTSIKTITYLSDTGCLEIQGASLGAFPAPIKLGRSSRWLKSEVEAWLQARIAQSRP